MEMPHIVLVDSNANLCEAWRKALAERSLEDKVEVVCEPVKEYLQMTPISSFVLFADVFGLMEDRFCDSLDTSAKESVRNYLLGHWCGEFPLGFCCGFPMSNGLPFCIYCASNSLPGVLDGESILYHSVRAALLCAAQNGLPSVLMSVVGAAQGHLSQSEQAQIMADAIEQVLNPPIEASLRYAKEHAY